MTILAAYRRDGSKKAEAVYLLIVLVRQVFICRMYLVFDDFWSSMMTPNNFMCFTYSVMVLLSKTIVNNVVLVEMCFGVKSNHLSVFRV